MMYPFMTLNDETEIVHSEMLPNGKVKVYIEKPDADDCFHHATCYLPEYEWTEVTGFTEEEMQKYKEIVESTAYFWTNENDPLEPVHVHVSEGKPRENSTKIWLTKSGKCLVANNNSQIPAHTLRNIVRILEARNEEISKAWVDYFGQIQFFI